MSNRPQPQFPEPNTQPYWQGVKAHELRYQRCSDCDSVVFYPRHHCPKCFSGELTWQVSAGVGTVYTYSVVRQNRVPEFIELGAYSVAYIDLDEGFRMMSTIIGVSDPTQDITIGQRVRVVFEAQEQGEFPIPVFTPC